MSNSIQAILSDGFTCPVRDVLWGHIYFTPELAELTDSAPFARLHRILQLGPVYRVYPGATHTRASHSIGEYHLGRRLLQNLAERGIADWISREGAMSFLCACLLHDLGHFPYTHSLKELSLQSHESLTGSAILTEPLKNMVGACGADPALTAAIVDKELTGNSACGTHNAELLFYRKLLSGCLDPDKLDYLNRDARYCGVPYGIQDVDFILSRLIPCPERGVDIDSRLIPNVEAILFAKYLMYRTVYWHRQVRAATSMIKKGLLEGLESGKIAGEDLYNLDDQGLFDLLRKKAGIPHASDLAEAVRNGRLYSAAAEIPFSEAEHTCLKDVSNRSRYEEQLADEFRRSGVPLGSGDIIIDVPESGSFETGLFVLDEQRCFAESSSAFKTGTLNSFVNTLYTIRIFINPLFCKKVETLSELSDILNGEKLWLRS